MVRVGRFAPTVLASPATTTRDLADLVAKGALVREGEHRYARYQLAVPLRPVPHVTLWRWFGGSSVLQRFARPHRRRYCSARSPRSFALSPCIGRLCPSAGTNVRFKADRCRRPSCLLTPLFSVYYIGRYGMLRIL